MTQTENNFLNQVWKLRDGQSLVEIVIALGIGALLMGAAVLAVVFMLKSGTVNEQTQSGSLFARSLAEQVRVVAGANWFQVYNLSSTTQYYVVASGTTLAVQEGKEGVLEDDRFDGLVAYWKIDEAASSTLQDSTSNNNDGNLIGATRAGSCRVHNCASFDGTDDYVSSSDASSLDLVSAITVMGWVKPTSTDGAVLFAKNDGTNFAWEVALESGKIFGRINAAGNSAQSSSTISASQWTHVAMVYSVASASIDIYLNGVLDKSAAYSTNISTNDVAVTLGRRLGGTPAYYQGLIDDVRIYNRTFSATEMRSIYNSRTFTRYFNVQNVERSGTQSIVSSGGTNDPSTRQVVVTAEWISAGAATSAVSLSDYLTRWQNRVFQQTDWSGGGGFSGPLTEPNNQYSSSTSVTTSTGSIKIDGL